MAWGGVAVGGTGSARQHTADAKQESTHAKGSRRRTGASISRTVTADGICNINIGSEFFSSPYDYVPKPLLVLGVSPLHLADATYVTVRKKHNH